MRLVRAAAIIALSVLIPSRASGQGTALAITNYQVVSEQRVTRTVSDVAYRADLVNTGPARTAVTATATSRVPSVQVMQGSLHFVNVPAGGRVTSSDTFTIRVDRSVPFDFANLQWTFPPAAAPVANAGPNQTVRLGAFVVLNGSLSSNPGGVGTLTYSWALTSRPSGSAAVLNNPGSVTPSFAVDVAGFYVATLTVSNGVATDSASVTISTSNTPPVANAGANQSVAVGATVVLNGSASSDVDGNPLTYSWTMIQRPAGSVALLSGAATISPTFVADRTGTYLAQLVVSDGTAKSAPATVSVTTQNTRPVANAGPGQTVNTGATVQLNGSGSTDVDRDPLTYQWSLITIPTGSTAILSSPTAVNPIFTADRPGTYVAQLIVSDGKITSTPSTVTIATNASQPPTASAGLNQTVKHGSTVTLNGSGTDPQARPLTYQWSLLNKPAGSTATLSGTTVSQPSFVADRPGSYVAQLIVSNGFLSSAPSTVTITTTNTAPVANAGPDQSVTAGSLVTLNGSASADADGDPKSYVWSLTTRPSGSNAVLSAATSATPTFVADTVGVYVIQLIVSDQFTGSTPDTITVTVQNRGTVLLSELSAIALRQSIEFPVSLSAPAPQGGLTLKLTASDTSRVALSTATVFIPEGATVPDSQPVITGLSPGIAQIGATGQGYASASQPVQVTATLTFTPTSLTINGEDTKSLDITLSAPAPAGGLAINVTSSDTGVATASEIVIIPQNATTVGVAVKGVSPGTTVIRASALNVPETSATVTVNRVDIILPANVVVPPGDSLVFPVTLAKPAQSPTFIALASSDPSKVTVSLANVFINAGQVQPAAPPRVTGISGGGAVITATATGLNTAQTTVQVGYAVSFASSSVTIPSTETQNLLLRLSGPAPQNGLSLALTSSNPNVAAVPPSLIFGAATTVVTVPVTGMAPGTAIIRASSPDTGEATTTVTVEGSMTILLPASTKVMAGRSAALPVSLSTAAAAGGVTVTLSSSDTSKLTVSPETVVIPAGQTQPTTPPVVSGISPGAAEIRASAPGYSSVSRPVQISTAPAQVIATSGTPQSTVAGTSFKSPLVVVVRDVAGNPVSGVVVTFALPSAGPGANFAGGVNTSTTNGAGLAAAPALTANELEGSYVVTAAVEGVAVAASFTLTNTPAVIPGVIAITPVTVGKNLQKAVTMALPEPAPAGGLRVTIRSGDPASMLVAGRPGDAGTAQIVITIGEGLTTASGIYVQSLSDSGTVSLIATASSTLSGTATITLSPSGFVLAGPNGIGSGSFTTAAGASTQLTLAAARLDPLRNYVELQQVRGGSSVSVDIAASFSSVGSVSPSPVTVPGGQHSAAVTFTALATGQTILTASVPADFTQPAQGTNTLTIQVISSTLRAPNVTVGRDLQAPAVITINSPAPASGLAVTLASSNADKLLLSQTPDRAGSPSITLVIPGGRTSTAEFYLQALTSGGSVTYTATAPGFGVFTGTVTLAPSGFVLHGPLGLGASLVTTTGGSPADLTVYPALLDSTMNVVELQQLRGGQSIAVEIANSNPLVGNITMLPVRFNGGSSYSSTQFQPATFGTTVLSVTTPANYSQPARYSSLSVTVKDPGIAVEDSISIGKNLQAAGTAFFGQLAPAGGLSVTLSTNSSQLLLSQSATTTGSSSITMQIPAGQSSVRYYLQALDESGSATYTISAPGYTARTATIKFAPAGVVIAGPWGLGFGLSAPKTSASLEVTIMTALLDPVTGAFVMPQPVAGGSDLVVTLNNSNPQIVDVASSVTIQGGSEIATTPLAQLLSGSATISVTTPAGYATPQNFTSLNVFVTE